MKMGFEVFMQNKKLQSFIGKKRLAYLGHCASVSKNLENSLGILKNHTSLNLTCIFSPQHGWYGVEQANMIPSSDGKIYGLPLFSLYKDNTRVISKDQLDLFDVLLIDLQDVGCRVYTYLTTVLYAVKICAENNKSVFILDRPNPVGRVVEGSYLDMSCQSVVGAWRLPIRYGLTLGEVTQAYCSLKKLNVHLEIVKMEGYNPNSESWPLERTWLAPSPNMTDVECARCYSGTVLLEGTNISEGRGTNIPLKIFGFPKMDVQKILKTMTQFQKNWMNGCLLRSCFFKPTFDKFKGEVCSAIQIHAEGLHYNENEFRPYRLICLFLKSMRKVYPDWNWLTPPPYEYEYKKMPIDILSGDSFLREWVEDESATSMDLENKLIKDEQDWLELSRPFYLY